MVTRVLTLAVIFSLLVLSSLQLVPVLAQQKSSGVPDVEGPPSESGGVEACDANKQFEDWTNVADFTCASGWKRSGSYFDPVDNSCTVYYRCSGTFGGLIVKYSADGGTVTVTWYRIPDEGQLSGSPDIEGPGPDDESAQQTPECTGYHGSLQIENWTCQEPGWQLDSTRKVFIQQPDGTFQLQKCESIFKCGSSNTFLLVTYNYETGKLDVDRIW